MENDFTPVTVKDVPMHGGLILSHLLRKNRKG
jgi:hypothetical protein